MVFTRKTDMSPGIQGSGDIVYAEDVNELQEAIETLQSGVYNVLDYGAVGDGVTDDSAAIQAAIDAAAAVSGSNVTYRKATVVFPGGNYRVASSLIAKQSVHIEGNGARLVGPITGYARIDSGTAVPNDDDVDGQTGGACFTDNETATATLYWPSFSNLTIYGFRYGFVSKCFAWAHPQFENIEFRYTDIGFFAYQGCQQWNFTNINAGYDTHSLFAAAATCFSTNHPYKSRDNFFCDGLRMDNRRQTQNLTADSDVDDWFEAAILRPATSSVVNGGSYTYAPTGTFRKVTGRHIFVPSRNNRGIYGWVVGPVQGYDCPRGVVLMRQPVECTFYDIAGEQMFTDVSVNTGPDESMVVIGLADGASVKSANFRNIDADNSAGGANYKGAIDIVLESGGTWSNTMFTGENITGACPTKAFQSLNRVTVASGAAQSQEVVHRAPRSTSRVPSAAAAGITDNTTNYLKLSQAYANAIADNEDYEVRRLLFAGRIPISGGAQTLAYLNISGTQSTEGVGQVIRGTLEIYVDRLDTGESDYAKYQVVLSQRLASTTLGADASTSDETITVASSGAANAFSPGTPIIVNSAEKYLVESVSGAVLTLAAPLTTDYSTGNTVVGTSEITRTITAFNSSYAAVTVASGMLRITNSIDPVPIRFHGVLEYPKVSF